MMQMYLSSIIQAKEYGKRYIRILFFAEKLLIFCCVKELFDSIATQSTEIRMAENSLPSRFKQSDKKLIYQQVELNQIYKA